MADERPPPLRIRGATILLTGATGGLGRALAEELAARGAHLVLTGRRTTELEALARRTGGRPIVADLADPAAVEALAATAGPVDVLVANAAVPASGPLLDYSPAEVDRVLAVNLRAPIALAHRLAGPMVERHRGHLVFLSSLSGLVASPGNTLYSATKFGLRGFAFGLRQDLGASGVGVSVVSPGFVRHAGMFADTGVGLPFGVGTSSPGAVARAVVSAVEHDRAEVLVAPLPLKLGTRVGAAAPALAAWFQRAAGADGVAARVVAAQRHRRIG
jgi:uncharacterized protein